MLLPDDRRPKDLLLSPSSFCPYSLGDWIGVCERAVIPHVPAMHVTDFERHDLLQHEEAGPHQERLDAAYEAVFAVGTPVTRRPPHRSGRARLRHPALPLGCPGEH